MKVAIVLFTGMDEGQGHYAAKQDIAASVIKAFGGEMATNGWTCEEGFRSSTFWLDAPVSEIEKLLNVVRMVCGEFFDKKNIKRNYGMSPFFYIEAPESQDALKLENEQGRVVISVLRIRNCHDDYDQSLIDAFNAGTLRWYGREHNFPRLR